MGYKFSYNGTAHELYSSTAKITSPSFAYRRDGATYYVPLLTSRSQTIGEYVYDASSPTMCCRYNNTTYYAVKTRYWQTHIPDGTYDPLVFERLVGNYVSHNSGRWARVNGGLFRVNNQSVQIRNNEGKAFFYYGTVNVGSGLYGTYRFISISATGALNAPQIGDLRNWGGCYIVYGTTPFQSYANYPISIFGGSSITFL